MLFNSYIFIFLFLPVTVIGFFVFSKTQSLRASLVWLTVMSLVFYSYWNPPFLLLLISSILGNFLLGKFIASAKQGSPKAKYCLILGVFGNLAAIAYYKYADFIASSINPILNTNWNFSNVFLPLGISFYTFTQIAYLVDMYIEGRKEQSSNLLDYSLFVSFFPQLIAGPILRHDELIPQFREKTILFLSYKNVSEGLTYFAIGLGKKMVIADTLSVWVSPVFGNSSEVSLIEAWIGALAYTFQLYYDFSGYSDMAIGLGKIFNIELPINFNSPYKSTSIGDFWRRWHITLSNFLRDYLYIPLGGNRKGELRCYLNLLTVMLLGGLWHGAGWTFIAWGGLHGLYLCVDRVSRKLKLTLPTIVSWVSTFIAVIFSWVLFRANSIQEGTTLWYAMIGGQGIRFSGLNYAYNPEWQLLVIAGIFLLTILMPNSQEIMKRFAPSWPWLLASSGLLIYCLLTLSEVSEFLYFQF